MHAPLAEDHIKKIALYSGLISLAAGIGMAFEYGRAMSWLHALSLSLLAIAGSLGFIGSDILRARGRSTAASIVAVATVGLLLAEYGTHFGYTVGHRVRDAQETGVQNTKYDGAKEAVAEAKSQHEWAKKRLAELTAGNPWITAVSVDQLKADVANLQGDFIFKRSKECADVTRPDSRSHCDKLATAKGRLANAEEFNKTAQMIDATKKVIDKSREKVEHTEFKSSKIVNQTQAFAQIAMWDDKPSEAALTWTQLILGAMIAAVTTYLAPFFFSIAFSDIRSQAKKNSAVAPVFEPRKPTVQSLRVGAGPAGMSLVRNAA